MPLPVEPDWSRIPALEVTGPAERVSPGVVQLPTSAGPLLVTALEFGVRLRLGAGELPAYPILVAEPAERPLSLHRGLGLGGGETQMSWDGFVLKLLHAPLSFVLEKDGVVVQRSATDGHFVRPHRLPPFARLESGWFASLDLASGEPVYGLGEKWGPLDKRGQYLRSAVFDALGVNAERSYKNAPFAWSPQGWGVFAHTPGTVHHGLGHPLWSVRAYGLAVEDEALDLFVMAGKTPADLIAAYTGLTGRPPVPPFWSLGVILSKAYYRDADELLSVAREVRERGMPCDTITLDGRAWQDTATRFAFEWDPSRYPDPKPVLDEVKRLGLRVCVWEYPLVSVTNPLFDEMSERGWLLKDRRNGLTYRYRWDLEPFGKILTPLPESGIVDFTHPEAYAYWRDRHRDLFALGVDMIKSDFGEQVEDDCLAHNGDTGARLRNVYPLLYNSCVYEAAERYCASGAFLFARSAWAGSQRFPMGWGGDPQADWEGLAGSLRGGLSWGLTGAPFYATDIGGFYADRRDAELYVRWTQAAVFSSHIRFHGIGAREPWSYGAEAAGASMKALELRGRLLPYIWKTVEQACETGLPCQRPMVLAFPGDRATWAFEEQFMFGEDLLVAPVIRPGGAVEVYLPHGRWHGFPEGATLEGGRVHRLTLALDEWAVFARDGAEIPMGPAIRHTGELGDRPVTEALLRFG